MKDEIRQLILNGEIESALDRLLLISDDFILLKSRWSGLRRDQNQGILTHEYFQRERNRITHAMIEMLDRINWPESSAIISPKAQNDVSPLPTTSTGPQPLKVFFSYSRHDKNLRDDLDKHLSTLKRQKYIDAWHDRDILPGNTWDEEIKRELRAADIILFLISADFLATDYIMDIELPLALERREKGEATIIPIILRPCLWEETPLADLLALPGKGIPITTWDSKDEALTEVVKGIKRVIDAKLS